MPDKYFEKYKQRGLDNEKACVYGMVENLDDNIGRILDHLDSLDMRDNTIVIFMTDNGPNTWRYNGGMKGKKAWVDEGGVRVPCFMRIPWMKNNGSTVEAISAHIDILPTLAELCHLELPVGLHLDGQSRLPFLKRPDEHQPERIIYTDRGLDNLRPAALRTEKWEISFKDDTTMYDLSADPRPEKQCCTGPPGPGRQFCQIIP